jgi:flagellar hook-associated protein 3 FlgL
MQANFFDVLDNLSATMEAENRKALSESLLPQIDSFIDNLLKCMATEGALENRYTNNILRFQSNNTNLIDLWDNVAGIDLSKAATDMAMLSAMYQASLSVISRIIQPTLVDFLR